MIGELRSFASLVLAIGPVIFFGYVAVAESVSHDLYVGLALAYLVVFFVVCSEVRTARTDPLGYGSVALPPLILVAAAFFSGPLTRPLLLLAWLWLAFFVFGGARWWSFWSAAVLRRPRRSDSDRERLRRAYYEVIDLAKRSDLTRPEFEDLRRKIIGLSRYRDAETDAFISLAQAELLDWAEQRTVDPEVAATRDREITQLGNELWPSGDKHRSLDT